MNCKRVKLSISVLFSQTDCQNLVRMIKKKERKSAWERNGLNVVNVTRFQFQLFQ